MTTLLQDIRYGLRMLVRAPAFTAVAVVTLALGIGANTAIFSIVHAVLLRPLPYPEPDRLVMVWQDYSARGGPSTEWATPGNYFDWRAHRDVFAGLAAIQGWQPTLTGIGEPEAIPGEQVTPGYFDVLGVRPAIGRGFREEDMTPGAARVVVLSDALWQRRFGADRAILGRRITLGGDPHEIIGVMPPDFRPGIAATAGVWRVRQLAAANPSRGAVILRVVARLQPGITHEQAQSSLTLLARQLEQAYPESNARIGIRMVSLHQQVVGDIRRGLIVLLGAVAVVLLIACANIANLLLARASVRGREVAVRLALGAERGRVVRQLLTESVLLAAIGGGLGVLFGVWALSGLMAIAPAGARRVNDITLNWTVLTFAAGLSMATGILFGLMPALYASRSGVSTALRDGARGVSPGPAAHRTRRSLIVAEIAVALVLLVGSGLLMRTFVSLQGSDLGFDPERVLVGAVLPAQPKYPNQSALVAFYDRLLERVSTLPGIDSAALSSVIPLDGDSDMDITIENRPIPPGAVGTPATWYRLVSAGYLDTMGIQLESGRAMAAREPTPVVIVNQTAARRFWPGENAIGKRVRFGSDPNRPWFTVVGVAADVKMRGAQGEPRTETYIPYWHFAERGTNVVLKASDASHLPSLVPALRQAVRDVDAELPVSGLEPMTGLVSRSIAQPRFLATIVAVFAGLALTLAAIGIYGVTSYAVAQRTAEIGVRMALGAGRGDVFALVIGDGVRLTIAGVALGAVASAAIARSIEPLLFGVAPMDPATFAGTIAALVLTATLACLVPARRAARVDPMAALRAE